MRKHFLLLMLMALLPLAGWAQFSVGNYVPKGNFIYEIEVAATASTPGKVILYGIRDGQNPVDATKALNLEGKITIAIVDGPSFDFVVNYANADALRNTFSWTDYTTAPTKVGAFAGMVTAESVVIPKEFLQIKANTFYGYTNMKSISFEANSEVTTIEGGSFNTTQISTFDFSNCSKLTAISDGVFVEGSPAVNSYVKTVKLPANSEALTTIGTAFQRLPELTTITNLEHSLITTVAADAFKGDAKLKTLALPGTVKTISANAFRGSGIENLTIDVTSLDDATAGNVYGSGSDLSTLKTLTLKGVLSGEFKSQAFKGCDELTTITMTNMTINGGKIGDSAFEGCASLTSLNFNDITEGTIGNAAFKGCSVLASVVFGAITGTDAQDALIDDNAFLDCPKLGIITFGNLQHVTIDQNAFKKSDDNSVSSPALTFGTLTDVDINASAFEGCSKLTAITFGNADGLYIASKAFAGCTSSASSATLTFNTLKDVVIAGTTTEDGAFYNTTKLSQITFGASENLTIQTYAFENTASVLDATLTFGNAINLQIGGNAFKGASYVKEITFGNIEDDDVASDEIAANAFQVVRLQTLTFGNLDNVQIKADAFNGATSSLTGSNYASATFGNLENGSQIEDGAFIGATRLNTVTIGDVTDSKIGSAGTTAAFPAVKTVTIGAVKSTTDATLIAAKAFTFANQSGATFNQPGTKSLETVAAATNALIAEGALDFSAVDGGGSGFVFPVVKIGELKTAKVLGGGALKGNDIAQIIFDGNIAAGALDVTVIEDEQTIPGVADLKLAALTFNGEIATGGIVGNAFASMSVVMTITFNGNMAAAAVATHAFKDLLANSNVKYTYNGADIDLTINPFAKSAFNGTYLTTRNINFFVTNTDLKDLFWGADGLGSDELGSTDHVFDIYRLIKAIEPDLSFLVYPDIVTTAKHTASPRTAWARWELGSRVDEKVTGTLAANTNLVIKRVQQLDGTNNAKITIYGTYTDEDDALNASTIYMMPLKVTNGYYHIPGDNTTTLIVKVENNGADFTANSYKVKVNQTDYPAYAAANNSIWTGLVNNELFVAQNIMTNEQLIDKTAKDGSTPVDIYRGTSAIVEDLYIMSDPSKNKGFRIDKTEITSSNNAYINTGWYYMLLKKYTGAPAAANVLWLDDATDDMITGILNVKHDVKNNAQNGAIYTLQGVRVSQTTKGQIYIQNGKKFIAK